MDERKYYLVKNNEPCMVFRLNPFDKMGVKVDGIEKDGNYWYVYLMSPSYATGSTDSFFLLNTEDIVDEASQFKTNEEIVKNYFNK